MIRRDDGNDWLLISQVDHAHLAAEIARVWGNESVPALPLPGLLIPAIRDHDEGWRDWEGAPEIDPQTGTPRDFTEMQMNVATEIWSKSIIASAAGTASQAAALRRYQEFLSRQNETLTGERAAALDSLLQFRASFRQDEAKRFAVSDHVAGDQFDAAFEELMQAGIVRSLGADVVGEYCVLDLASMGESPLGGLWVSSHFCYLAEKARENRPEQSDDLTAIEGFIAEQKLRQKQWTNDAVRDFAGDEFARLLTTGYRYVQFFDRMSLWLCCAERTTGVEMALPGGETFQLTPEAGHRVRIEPFPLNVGSLELSVNVRRIPGTAYVADEALQEAIAEGGVESLAWTLC